VRACSQFGLTYSEFRFERHISTPAALTARRSDLLAARDVGDEEAGLLFACVVTNTGGRDADAVALAFVRPPRESLHTEITMGEQPRKRLVGFERVSLQPQETFTLSFRLTASMLSGIDVAGKQVIGAVGERWEVEVGDVDSPARAVVTIV
jgi:hypothetical protein